MSPKRRLEPLQVQPKLKDNWITSLDNSPQSVLPKLNIDLSNDVVMPFSSRNSRQDEFLLRRPSNISALDNRRDKFSPLHSGGGS